MYSRISPLAETMEAPSERRAKARRGRPVLAPSALTETSRSPRGWLLRGAGITSLGVLTSRVLGLVRDMVTASLLGMSGSPAMDALVLAFRIPNLFRGVFGEGALTASFLPVFAEQLEHDRNAAWQLGSAALVALAGVLGVILLIAETACAALLWAGGSASTSLLVGLTAVTLPYLVLVCLAAQVTAMLNALGHFRWPALAPALVNVCWLVGAWWVAPHLAATPDGRAYVLAACIGGGGALQLAVQWPSLLRLGFRFDLNFAAAWGSLRKIGQAMGPMTLGLAITQINTFMDSLIAWLLAATPGGPATIGWLGGVPYPMRQGAASAIYYGERMYQFPLGLIGVAVATAVFPLLNRHAARQDQRRLAGVLTMALRLVFLLSIPAAVGMMLLAQPIARLLFERGSFMPEDTLRTARMIAGYSTAIWAFCSLPVIVRGFYALGDRMTPVKVGAAAVLLNLTLDLTLIWPLSEVGLAVSTAVSAMLQVCVLLYLLSARHAALDWRSLSGALVRTGFATTFMAAAVLTVRSCIPAFAGVAGRLISVAAPLTAGLLVYFAVQWLLGAKEIGRAEFRRDSLEATPT